MTTTLNNNDSIIFIPIVLATLRPDSVLPVDMYVSFETDERPQLYRDRSYPLSSDDLERLCHRGIKVVYIPDYQLSGYQDYLCEQLGHVLLDDNQPVTARYQFLSETARGMLDRAFSSRDTNEKIGVATNLGDYMVDIFAEETPAASDVLQVLRHDYCTFAHSFNVASYCVLLAKRLGITGRSELQELAVAGLLHDLGKLNVPPTILNKKGRLTSEEFEVIKRHPTDGFLQLCSRDDLTRGQLMVVYQHHERLDGSGYPCRAVADDIHPYAKLCAVVDVFEAMTSARPYRGPMPTQQVIEFLAGQSGSELDQEIVKCWIAEIK